MRLFSTIGLGLVWLVGLMPWWILHLKSAGIAFFLANVIGYRRKVVIDNLNLVGAENVSIYGVYRNLTDLGFESLKLLSVSIPNIKKRLEFENIELLEKLHSEGKNVVLVGGHMANWEVFSLVMPGSLSHKTYAVYKKLNNEVFDEAVRESRGRSGMKIVEMNELPWIIEDFKGSDPILCSLIFDQSPRNPKHAYWTEFLGVETPVYAGIEKLSVKMDASVVYAAIDRIGNGRYVMRFSMICEDAKNAERGEIIDRCCGKLEKEIVKRPENWLWTHRRWKHKRPEGVKLNPRKFTKFKGWS